jgi:hypothetical protein
VRETRVDRLGAWCPGAGAFLRRAVDAKRGADVPAGGIVAVLGLAPNTYRGDGQLMAEMVVRPGRGSRCMLHCGRGGHSSPAACAGEMILATVYRRSRASG